MLVLSATLLAIHEEKAKLKNEKGKTTDVTHRKARQINRLKPIHPLEKMNHYHFSLIVYFTCKRQAYFAHHFHGNECSYYYCS